MSLARQWSGLSARFDRLALRPPAAAAPATAADAALSDRLQAWCHRGAGPGASPWHQPGRRPAVATRLAVAALRTPDGRDAVAFADALARQLDGSTRLEALVGRRAALTWRLQVKLQDAMWWRERRQDDPWDAGWAIDTPPALRQWRSGFMPRRATLVLADAQAAAALRPVLAALVQRGDHFHHPLRWLWVGGASDLPEQNGMAVERFEMDAVEPG